MRERDGGSWRGLGSRTDRSAVYRKGKGRREGKGWLLGNGAREGYEYKCSELETGTGSIQENWEQGAKTKM